MLSTLHIFWKKTHLFGILILILIGGGLSAEGLPHVIGSVILNVEGKTNTHLLQNEMDFFPYEEQFETKESLVARAEERKNFLFNKRIFESVECSVRTLETTEEFYVYQVVYDIVDAVTFLPIPYGKYDSNYGLKLGMKMYDTNLLGSLANMYLYAGVRQLDVMSLDQIEITSTMNVTNLKILNQRFDVSMNFLINRIDGILKEGTYSGSIKWSGISIFDQTIDVFSNINLTQYYDADISIWGNPNINAGFNWRNISILDENFSLYFNTNLRKSGVSWDHPNLTFTTRLSSSTLSLFDKGISANLEHVYALSTETGSMTSRKVNAGISTSYSLPSQINYTISGKLLTNHSIEPFGSIDFVLGNTFTHGRINWVDNFREGDSTRLSISATMPFDEGFTELVEQFSTYSVLQATYFTMLGDGYNLSLRGIGYVATNLPKGFPVVPGAYMRGILNKNLPSESGYAGLSLNTNLTIKLFDFTIFIFDRSPDGEFLISPFIDFSIFDSTTIADTSGPAWIEFSGGMEFYLIFDRLRSYPFCATAGANLKDVADFIQGDKQFNQIEFEILLSLSMFY